MAITWEWELGAHFEDDSALYEFGSGNYSGVTVNSGATRAKTGSRGWDWGWNGRWGIKACSASRQKRSGAFWYRVVVPSGSARLFSFRDAANNHLAELRVNPSGVLALYVAGSEQDTATLTATGWLHVALDVKIDSSAGWAVGYVDGVESLRYEGNTGNADIAHLYFSGGPNSADSEAGFDDWYCEDTTGEGAAAAVPIKYFYELRPNGNGNYSQFTGSDGNQTDNYALCDEAVPNEDSDYVAASAADQIDSYAMGTFTLPAAMTISAVHACVIAKKLGTAGTQVKPFLRENSTDWAGTAVDTTTDYLLYKERRTTCPDGTAWDQTGIDSLEAGAKSAGAFS